MPKPKPGLNTPPLPKNCAICGLAFDGEDYCTLGAIVNTPAGYAHKKCATKQGAPKKTK